MINKGIEFVKKILSMPFIAEKISYLFFGVLTTIVNFVVFGITNGLLNIDYRPATVMAWVVAVTFAFITNKLFVFESKSFEAHILRREMTTFLAARVLSLLFDIGWMIFAVEMLNMNEYIAKILSNVVVIVINYFLSKLFVFKKKI